MYMRKLALDFDDFTETYISSLYREKTGFINYRPGEKEACVQEKVFLTYGEILPSYVDLMIKKLDIRETDVFYDLGSGVGKVGLHFFLKTPIKKAYGIEFFEQRHEIAKKIYQQVEQQSPELFLNGRVLGSIQENFLKMNLSDATIIYTCSTCFSEELLKDIGDLALQCQNLRYLISLKPIPSLLLLVEVLEIECTWGWSNCYIYKT